MVGVMDVESTDELGQILMADMPIARYLDVKEVLPIREYEAFASDIMQRWQQQIAWSVLRMGYNPLRNTMGESDISQKRPAHYDPSAGVSS